MDELARSTTERARIVSTRECCSSEACACGGGRSELRDEANAVRASWRARNGLCAPCGDGRVEDKSSIKLLPIGLVAATLLTTAQLPQLRGVRFERAVGRRAAPSTHPDDTP